MLAAALALLPGCRRSAPAPGKTSGPRPAVPASGASSPGPGVAAPGSAAVSAPQPDAPANADPVLVTGTLPLAPQGVAVPLKPVVLELLVGASGAVESVRVVRSLTPQFDRLAVEAARTWTYRPARRDGKPVAAKVSASVTFRRLT